ncbi:hypothetical protein ACI8AA_06935 [Geodermatophilus sp. SYSU D01180]
MVMLADFTTIIGDTAVSVPVVSPGAEFQLGSPFDTGGRLPGTSETGISSALLMFAVRNMSGTAQVTINDDDDVVGTITPSPSQLNIWSTQVIAFAGSRLSSASGTNNRIRLRNVTDAFQIKDVVCFFHQDS